MMWHEMWPIKRSNWQLKLLSNFAVQ